MASNVVYVGLGRVLVEENELPVYCLECHDAAPHLVVLPSDLVSPEGCLDLGGTLLHRLVPLSRQVATDVALHLQDLDLEAVISLRENGLQAFQSLDVDIPPPDLQSS